MAVINPPAWMQAGSYPARNDRLVISALLGYPGYLVDESTPMRIRQGVKPSYQQQQLKVRAAPTPNMTIIVSAGFAFIDNHDTGGAGTYVCANDADVTLTVDPAGGAGQFRKDCVVASVYDAETAGALSEWKLEIIKGTYAASAGAAVRPSLPPNAQILADVAVGASVTSISTGNITDVRQFSVAAGGIMPVASSGTPNRPHPGQVFYQTNLDKFVYGKSDGSTAALLDSAGASTIGKALFKHKLGVDTDRATATMAADPHLSFALEASAVYEMEGMLYLKTTDHINSDINIDFNTPAGADGRWMGIGQGSGATTTDGEVRTVASAVDAARAYGATLSAGDAMGIMLRGLVVTTTAGTYALSWARTGGTGTVTLYGYSWMKLTRQV